MARVSFDTKPAQKESIVTRFFGAFRSQPALPLSPPHSPKSSLRRPVTLSVETSLRLSGRRGELIELESPLTKAVDLSRELASNKRLPRALAKQLQELRSLCEEASTSALLQPQVNIMDELARHADAEALDAMDEETEDWLVSFTVPSSTGSGKDGAGRKSFRQSLDDNTRSNSSLRRSPGEWGAPARPGFARSASSSSFFPAPAEAAPAPGVAHSVFARTASGGVQAAKGSPVLPPLQVDKRLSHEGAPAPALASWSVKRRGSGDGGSVKRRTSGEGAGGGGGGGDSSFSFSFKSEGTGNGAVAAAGKAPAPAAEHGLLARVMGAPAAAAPSAAAAAKAPAAAANIVYMGAAAVSNAAAVSAPTAAAADARRHSDGELAKKRTSAFALLPSPTQVKAAVEPAWHGAPQFMRHTFLDWTYDVAALDVSAGGHCLCALFHEVMRRHELERRLAEEGLRSASAGLDPSDLSILRPSSGIVGLCCC